ncbi:MAG: RidA family protein [Pseudomonadota bacterium]
MDRKIIKTDQAPEAIGTYSQAVNVSGVVYLSGQIPLDPKTMELETGDFELQIKRVFDNLSAVAEAAGGDLSKIVKLNIFLQDLSNFSIVNKVMSEYFDSPYPARAVVGVNDLPKDASVEMDAIMQL